MLLNSIFTKTNKETVSELNLNISKRDIIGYFESIKDSAIEGWVADKLNPTERLKIELYDNGLPILRSTANNMREDVAQSGIGDGKYGFTILLPDILFDNNEHTLDIKEVSTGYALIGSGVSFHGKPVEFCNIEMDGSALVGWSRLPDKVNSDLSLNVYDGGNCIANGHCTIDTEDSTIVRFRLSLPTSALDGRPHKFTVCCKGKSLKLGEIAVITPYMLTPESVLQEYIHKGLSPSISTSAGFRYESLVKTVEKFSKITYFSFKEDSKITDNNDFNYSEKQLTEEIRNFSQVINAHNFLVKGFLNKSKNYEPLFFPSVENPLVSIVIPIHNKFNVTYFCLCSLLLSSNNTSYELVIVDDGSIDESRSIPEIIKGVKYTRNAEPLGFIRSCNRGAELSIGKYVVMLNNDTEVTSGWLDELLWPFNHFTKVGLTGAKLLYPDGTLQEAGGIVWNNGDPWNYGRRANPHDPRYNYARQVDYLSGACIMIPRHLWKELGGFDEYFLPAYFEDTDIAFRIRQKGYKAVFVPFSQVIHFEGISSGINTSNGVKRYQEVNRPKFKQRWVHNCRNNGKVGIDLDLSKDRNIEYRALVIDAETPMPDQNAGSYAAIQEMRMLQALGFKCTFIPQNIAWMGHYTQALQRMGIETIYAPFVSSINEVIEKRGAEFDLIYITRYYVAQTYVESIRQFAPHAKIVLNNADLHFLRELRTALKSNSSEVLERAVSTRGEELFTMRKVDLVLSYTDVEKTVILSHNLDSTRVAKCPWSVEVIDDVPTYESRHDIAFLGGYGHYPNVEAVEYFIVKIMPIILERDRNIKFRIYGSNVPNKFFELSVKNKNIVIEGWVPKVSEVYNSCRVFIAPLQSGAGIKGKVIGALAHGVPSVLSPIAAEGIPLADGVDACIAEKPKEWVSTISTLYNDMRVWNKISNNALSFAKSRYGFEKCVVQMQEALQKAEIFTSPNNNNLSLSSFQLGE